MSVCVCVCVCEGERERAYSLFIVNSLSRVKDKHRVEREKIDFSTSPVRSLACRVGAP